MHVIEFNTGESVKSMITRRLEFVGRCFPLGIKWKRKDNT